MARKEISSKIEIFKSLKFYTDINKARALLKYYSDTPNSHDYAWNRGWRGEGIQNG